MADVFVSYKSEDRPRVQPLVVALEADGLSVWWDAHIAGGASWRQNIQEHLESAKCVIVAWTKRSVGPEGDFVKDEATRGRRRGVYLPVRFDDVEPPLGFGEIQALSLTGWKGDRADPRYQTLLSDVRATIEREPRSAGLTAVAPTRIDRRLVLAGGGILALGAAGAGAWLLLKPSPASAKGIAVLPFANLSGDPSQQYFSDGMSEELRSALARLPDLKVIGRISSEAVRDEDAPAAAEKLGVGSLLTGSVRRSTSMIRVNAQLIDGDDGAQLWSESYDRAPGDALAVQADIAASVASALSIELGQNERAALTAGGTNNATAHDLYLRAKQQWDSSDGEAALRRAIALLDAALALDREFAVAHAEKAGLLVDTIGWFSSDEADLKSGLAQAEAAARRALEIAPNLALGYSALAKTAMARLDGEAALAMYERARALGGIDPRTLSAYGMDLSALGRSREGELLVNEALALDPLDPGGHLRQAIVLRYARRYPDAMAAARRALQIAPQRLSAYLVIGESLVLLGRPKEALAEYAKATDDHEYVLVGQAIAYAKIGDRAASDGAFERLRKVGGDAFHYQYAQVHAQRGEVDQAFASLNLAWKFRDPGLIQLKADPLLDPLRADPRLRALVRGLKLP